MTSYSLKNGMVSGDELLGHMRFLGGIVLSQVLFNSLQTIGLSQPLPLNFSGTREELGEFFIIMLK